MATAVPLSSITAAVVANTINNSAHAQVWNWALDGNDTAFTFGETTAATGVNNTLLQITTLSSSTASPLTVTNGGTGNIVFNLASTGDLVIQDNGTTFLTFDDSSTTTWDLPTTGSVKINAPNTTVSGNGILNITATSITNNTRGINLSYTFNGNISQHGYGIFVSYNRNATNTFDNNYGQYIRFTNNQTGSPLNIGLIVDLTSTDQSTNYGGYFQTKGTGNINYGIYAASTASTTNYAGFFSATATSNANYGVYANASGASQNYAIYATTDATTAGGGVNINANSLTTGTALNVTSNSTLLSSGKLISAEHTATFATSLNYSSNALNLNRNLTLTGGVSTVPVFDASSSAQTPDDTFPTSLTFNHTIGNGSNRILVVGISQTANQPVASVTYAGNQMTLACSNLSSNAGVLIYYMTDNTSPALPSAGTWQVSISWGSGQMAVAGAVSYFNVNQSAPLGNCSHTTISNTTPSITVQSNANDVVFDVLQAYHRSPFTVTPNASQTQRWNSQVVFSGLFTYLRGAGSTKTGESGSTNMSWTLSITPLFGRLSGVAIKGNSINLTGALASLTSTCSACYDNSSILAISSTSTTAAGTSYGLSSIISKTGAGTGNTATTYAGFFSATGDNQGTTTTYGIYAKGSGANTNWAGVLAGPSVVGDGSPPYLAGQSLLQLVGNINNGGNECPVSAFGGCVGLFVTPTVNVNSATPSDTARAIAARLIVDNQTSSGITLDTAVGLSVHNPTKGAADNIVKNYGILIDNQNAGSSANYGLYIEGATNYALYSASGNGFFAFQPDENLTLSHSAATTTNGTLNISTTSSTNQSKAINISYTYSNSSFLTGGYGIYGTFTHSNSATANYLVGSYYKLVDATNQPNGNFGLFLDMPISGNAAKTNTGQIINITSTSTTADKNAGIEINVSQTGVISSGTKSIYGIHATANSDNTSSGGTSLVYGGVFLAIGDTGGNNNTYGIYAHATGGDNNYGLFVANGRVFFNTNMAAGTTGNYICLNTTTWEVQKGGASCSASSIRFKENINDLTYGLEDVLKLHPVSFNFKPEMNMGSNRQLGFIAEEVERLIPELVSYDENGLPSGVNYPQMTSLLAKGIQELNAKVDNLGNIVGQNVTFENLTVNRKLLTANLTAPADNSLTLSLSDSSGSTAFKVLDSENRELFSIDSAGNVKFAGTVFAQSFTSTTQTTTENSSENNQNPPPLADPSTVTELLNLTNLETENLKVKTKLQVLGQSSLAATSVAGIFSQDGTLIMESGNSIYAVDQTLYLQKEPLAGPQDNNLAAAILDIGNGKVIVDKAGNLIIVGTLTAQKVKTKSLEIDSSGDTVGTATLPEGQTTVVVKTAAVTDNSIILVTPTTPTNYSLAVTVKKAEEEFWVAIPQTAPIDIPFNWLIINQTQLTNEM